MIATQDTTRAAAELEAEAMMLRYKETGDRQLRNDLVMHYSYIARTVAVEMRNTYQKYATMDEMINQGIIALIESIERFDPDMGVKFSTFAFTKIRGAAIDYVRKQDWLPRRVRQNSIRINQAHDQLAMSLGRTPTREEMAEHMDMTPEEFDKCIYEISGDRMLSYEALLSLSPQAHNPMWPLTGDENDPEHQMDDQELRKILADEIDKLTEQERTVLSLYYYEELTMREIAQVMGVSEQRIGQVNRKLITKLRGALLPYMKG
jgi:RNA polymerase sigma factor for flagellar operon FliA